MIDDPEARPSRTGLETVFKTTFQYYKAPHAAFQRRPSVVLFLVKNVQGLSFPQLWLQLRQHPIIFQTMMCFQLCGNSFSSDTTMPPCRKPGLEKKKRFARFGVEEVF